MRPCMFAQIHHARSKCRSCISGAHPRRLKTANNSRYVFDVSQFQPFCRMASPCLFCGHTQCPTSADSLSECLTGILIQQTLLSENIAVDIIMELHSKSA